MKRYSWSALILFFISSVLAHASATPKVYLVRNPDFIKSKNCKVPGGISGVIVFASEAESLSHRPGEKFSIALPGGDILVGELFDREKTNGCHPFGGEESVVVVAFKSDRPISWPERRGLGALLAVAGTDLKKDHLGTVMDLPLPTGVQNEVHNFAPKGASEDTTRFGQIVSLPRSEKKYGVITAEFFPADYEHVGDKGITYSTSLWEIKGGDWKFISKTEGATKVLAVTDLLGDGTFQIATSESSNSSGSYNFREYKNGSIGKLIKTLYSWMD